MAHKLLELFVKDKVISQKHYEAAVQMSEKGQDPIRYLLDQKLLAEPRVLQYLSQKFHLPSVQINRLQIASEVVSLLPQKLARKYQVIPVQKRPDALIVVTWDPTRLENIEELRFAVKTKIEVLLTSLSAFEEVFRKCYGGTAFLGEAIETYQKQEKDSAEEAELEVIQVHSVEEGGTDASEAPVIKIVNGILTESIHRGVSDIHVESYEHLFRVRMRIDGTLHEVMKIPHEMRRAVVARLKIMARLDIAETRIPQDGRIKLRYGGREIDFRVSSLPTIFGEKIVLRLLSKGNLQLDLKKLGFEPSQLEVLQKGILAPNGMVLVTGPTGSGKTTTLYSCLMELNKISENVSTVEDPVEYNLEGINQVQVHSDIGLTFASVLRSLLRQDPDIILVGEIRDYETAEVATQSALTGHLVLSTLHTNDAPSTITRLMNIGMEPFLVTASINTILAQRLVRMICPSCRAEEKIPLDQLQKLGFQPEVIQKATFYRGKGCSRCTQTGYKGRVAIYEAFDFSQDLKELILEGKGAGELKKHAVQKGMLTLRQSALLKALAGQTTLEEALSVTMEG